MIRILMLGGTGAIGESILSVIGNDVVYDITVTSRNKRKSLYANVHYLLGNANDFDFINTIEDNSFDVLIDFMNYRNEILKTNFSKLIRIAKQYVFLSSARVYDNSMPFIDESCSLLANTTENQSFKDSGTYAVKKAHQEKYVLKNGCNKVTIVRPYKTYSSDRLQLGEYEIKHWLNRIINDKPIVLNRGILDKYTALTDGVDVAKGIVELLGNEAALGQIFQVVTNEYMTWNDVLLLYSEILHKYSYKPVIYLADDTKEIDKLFEGGYQMPYDIMYNRRFHSANISKITQITYKSMKDGLQEAIALYLQNHTKGNYISTHLVTDDYKQMLNEVDAVYVVSPPKQHYQDIKTALEYKKHILCESPITVSKSECTELFSLAKKNGCILIDAIKTAYATAFARLILLAKEGKIGDIYSVDAVCTSLRPMTEDSWNSICGWGPTAMLPIFDILGTEYRSKNISSLIDKNGNDQFTKVDFSYDHAVASLKVGKGVKSEGELIISGTKGYIYVPAPWWKTDYFEIRYEDSTQNKRYFYQLDGEGIRYELVAFVKAINSKKDLSNIRQSVSETVCEVVEDFYGRKEMMLL